ncbi:hypothetical protein BA768_11125 [Chryseobacterium sp. CBo1]|nr:hypothetical protein BA768_11125 [Chryseobacterium sp. CBo1]
MKTYPFFSENDLSSLSRELQQFRERMQTMEVPFDESQILFDEDISSIRTVRAYRKKKHFRCRKISGSAICLKFYFYIDLLELFHKQNSERNLLYRDLCMAGLCQLSDIHQLSTKLLYLQ